MRANPGERGRLVSVLSLLLWLPGAAAADTVLLPGSVEFRDRRAAQQLLLEETGPPGYTGDRTRAARFTSSNPRVATVDPRGVVRPSGDGACTITAVLGGRRATARIVVRGLNRPATWSFTRHVLPILTRAGCNSGACHGAAAGKGGLKLSLRGYDPAADHAALTRQVRGRRVTPAAPQRSLMLLKATMESPHGGGRRFEKGSREYRYLASWIASGAPAPFAGDATVAELEVYPRSVTLRKGDRQRLVVRARMSDGSSEDVSAWSRLTSSEDSLAPVSDDQVVTVAGHGEATIAVAFGGRVGFARITSPHGTPVPPEVYARSPRHNFIDDLVLARLRSLNIPPAGQATDAEFLRRVYLDVAGILPTAEEVQEFVVDPDPARREKAVDRLLARPEFVDYWSYRWSELLLVSSRKLPARGMWAFSNWIRESVARNAPWDQFVRDIVTAAGSTYREGPANFYVLHREPIDLTETTTQAFLGVSLTCARCHNHPLEKWTLTDYYGMANLFARVRVKNGETAGETVVYDGGDGDVNHLLTGQPVPPRPLDGVPMDLDAAADRRAHLAAWLTSPQNPFFARSIVNRVWRNLMGKGLVDPEDDLRLTNPPSNEALFSRLTREFVAWNFDVRRLIRTIALSAAYQRSSVPRPGSPQDERYYSTYLPRRLPAEVLLDAIATVTGIPTEFPGYPKGTRAQQLPDSQVASYFLTTFGRAPRVQTCSCERQEETSVVQALHLANGETINQRLRANGSIAAALAAAPLGAAELLDRAYRVALGRPPTPSEVARITPLLGGLPAGEPARREAIEDLFAALMTTREFLFNH